MKTKIFAAFAALAGVLIIATGCVSTVSGTKSPALTWSKDRVSERYQCSVDQLYQASLAAVQNDGVLITEFIPHDTTNTARALQAKVNQHNVWVRVEAVDPTITQVTVQARSSAGLSDVGLASQVMTDIALQLQAQLSRQPAF
ncbi:MAG TPA: DUF3568 family protein [Verrucomicrobiae bacterium]|nr:DUF3568 family protein [Verrucomicrobiae bacterium]